jgi:hypothetical protein
MVEGVLSPGELIELAWFQPWHIIMYCVILFTLMVVYYQWKWSKIADKNMYLLMKRADGSTYSDLVKKEGTSVTLRSKRPGEDNRVWPINELCTLDIPYPGVGFVPAFLQKKIKMVILDEEDWEPLINRDPDKKLIASPAVLGNLILEQVTRLVVTINKDMLDKMEGLASKMSNAVTPQTFYIGTGLILIAVGYLIVQTLSAPDMAAVMDELELIKKAQGIISP